MLLEGGADPDLADSTGQTPLMGAAACGHLEALRLLFARGAALDLRWCAIRGADGATAFGDGATAFHLACEADQADCAEALARAGCDVGIKNCVVGLTGRQIAEKLGHDLMNEDIKGQLAYMSQFVNVSSEMYHAIKMENIDEAN